MAGEFLESFLARYTDHYQYVVTIKVCKFKFSISFVLLEIRRLVAFLGFLSGFSFSHFTVQ